MKISHLVAALVLLIIVLGLSFYYSIQPGEKGEITEEKTIIEEIEEEAVTEEIVPEKIGEITPIEMPTEAIVEIKDGLFIPAEITIKEGMKVTWINKDTRAHKVAAYSRHFYGDIIKPGESYSFAFNYSGVYKYFDIIWSKTMRNGIVRVEKPYTAITGSVITKRESETTGIFTILVIVVVLVFFFEVYKKR